MGRGRDLQMKKSGLEGSGGDGTSSEEILEADSISYGFNTIGINGILI
ncbi:hypothetical protein SRABI80_03052 [Peribacillus frigoritolerans]|nr:hypothetical protein SRABI80_03052 [Peribacillus frigoritolerans]